MGNVPVACSLQGPALGIRQSELRRSVLRDATTVERLPDGYRWRFAHAAYLFSRLGPLIDGERQCCRFLHFAVLASEDQGTVTLDITGPTGTLDVLESWISNADGRHD